MHRVVRTVSVTLQLLQATAGFVRSIECDACKAVDRKMMRTRCAHEESVFFEQSKRGFVKAEIVTLACGCILPPLDERRWIENHDVVAAPLIMQAAHDL
jgi:hypothetical protein